MILTGLYMSTIEQNYTNFSEARHHRAQQNSKIMAIEPMNRMAGSSISRDINRRAVRPSETISSHVDFGQCAEWRISRILFKRFFAVD
jgi:hypothetical protein